MDRKNYINLKRTDQSKYIYRYISFKRLYQLFSTQENALVRPASWDDPFENYILNSTAQVRNGSRHEFGFRDKVYGQCWTTERRSDAMWRIYSTRVKNGRFSGVRIRTTIERLANSLTEGLETNAKMHAFIGRVRYVYDKELWTAPSRIFSKGFSPRMVAQTLLIKRKAFLHEKEIRIIFRDVHNEPSADGLFRYKINPHTLIDQIMIDPRTDPTKIHNLKKEISEKTGFQGVLVWSLLYKHPKKLVFSVGL